MQFPWKIIKVALIYTTDIQDSDDCRNESELLADDFDIELLKSDIGLAKADIDLAKADIDLKINSDIHKHNNKQEIIGKIYFTNGKEGL